MGLPINIRNYLQHKAILDAAVERGGARYRTSSKSEATRWRMEAYQFRKLFVQNRQKELNLESVTTPYDSMKLSIDGTDVVIKFAKNTGFLVDLDNNVVPIQDAFEKEDAALEEDAARLRKELGLD